MDLVAASVVVDMAVAGRVVSGVVLAVVLEDTQVSVVDLGEGCVPAAAAISIQHSKKALVSQQAIS